MILQLGEVVGDLVVEDLEVLAAHRTPRGEGVRGLSAQQRGGELVGPASSLPEMLRKRTTGRASSDEPSWSRWRWWWTSRSILNLSATDSQSSSDKALLRWTLTATAPLTSPGPNRPRKTLAEVPAPSSCNASSWSRGGAMRGSPDWTPGWPRSSTLTRSEVAAPSIAKKYRSSFITFFPHNSFANSPHFGRLSASASNGSAVRSLARKPDLRPSPLGACP